MPYCQLFYHVVWSTKNRQPLLTPDIEPIIHNFLRAKAIGLGGTVFALNGKEDHTHAVVSIPAKIAVAIFIGQMKGVASAKFNQRYPSKPAFFWQAEYGAFTFDGKRLPNVIDYVERQKEHHARGTIIPILERDHGDVYRPIIHEAATVYHLDDTTWRQEMLALGSELLTDDEITWR